MDRIAVTVSVGVAAMPELSCARPEDLLDLADQALCAAKRSGRNRTVLAGDLAQPDRDAPSPAVPPAMANPTG